MKDTNATHLKNYRKNVDIVKNFGSDLFVDKALAKYEQDNDVSERKPTMTPKEYANRVRERMTAVALLKRSDDNRYTELKLSVRDQFAFGID